MEPTERYHLKILGFYKRHRRMPSYGEILALTGLRSRNAVYKLVNRLVERGIVLKDATGRLIPRHRFFGEVSVLGTVEAGFPSPAEEELTDTMSLDDYLIENKQATYLLKVKGDSMIEGGIMPGDMVLVERGLNPQEGDIVIAEVDEAWTMKYFTKRAGRVGLLPGNKKYRPIYPREELKIAAVVKAVVRKY